MRIRTLFFLFGWTVASAGELVISAVEPIPSQEGMRPYLIVHRNGSEFFFYAGETSAEGYFPAQLQRVPLPPGVYRFRRWDIGYGTQDAYDSGFNTQLMSVVVGETESVYWTHYESGSSVLVVKDDSVLTTEEQIHLFFVGAAFICPLLAVMLVIKYARKAANSVPD